MNLLMLIQLKLDKLIMSDHEYTDQNQKLENGLMIDYHF